MAKKLNPGEERFVIEYMRDSDGTAAYKRAGFKATGHAATVNASKMLARPAVRAEIDARLREIAERCEVTLERTLKEVARVSFFDPRKLFNADGTPKAITELDDDTAAALAGIEVLEQYEGSGKERVFVGYVKKYRIADKNAALEKLMKNLGGYAKDNAQSADAAVAAAAAVVEAVRTDYAALRKSLRKDR